MQATTHETAIRRLIEKMTLDEKISLCHGYDSVHIGNIPRLGIPELGMLDGPQGIRLEDGRTATALPCGIALACTWDPEAAYEYGALIGREALASGHHVSLGPGLNMMRTPLNGRNFEYYGEDPVLAGKTAAGYIRGCQDTGAAATPKHLALNNQEICRTIGSSNIDERSLRELYLTAFEIAVKEGHPWMMMSSYNKINGTHASACRLVQQQIVKDEFGFDGVMVSDWGGAHDTRGCALGGLDLEMGQGLDSKMGKPLLDMVKAGEIPEAVIDDKVRRVLRLFYRTGRFAPTGKQPQGELDTPRHHGIARKLARESMVLLKNDRGFLPLNRDTIKTLAVIGPNADFQHHKGDLAVCGGSGAVHPAYEITPLAGLKHYCRDKNIQVLYAPGLVFDKPDMPRSKDPIGMVGGRDGAGLPHEQAAISATKQPAKTGADDYSEEALKIAAKADAVIFCGGTNHSYDKEAIGWGDVPGADIPDLELIGPQAKLIGELAKVNPRLAVVLINGSVVRTETWIDRVPALLEAWYPGMEGGHALAELLFGEANPSGKLCCTWGRELGDYACHANGNYPGVRDGERSFVNYDEGLFTGYRHFDRAAIEPRFPFGFGLSYTTFDIALLDCAVDVSDVAAPRVTVRVRVANTGSRAGAEVVQLYVGDDACSSERPRKELKAFRKVWLEPGDARTMELKLGWRDFAFWSPERAGWIVEPGQFTVFVGNSCRHVSGQAKIALTAGGRA